MMCDVTEKLSPASLPRPARPAPHG